MNSLNDNIKPCNENCSFCFLSYAEILRSNFLFKGLKSEDVAEIIKNVHHQVKSYNKGDLIASCGEICSNLRIIVEGAVVGEMMDFQGKSLRIDKLSPPSAIASAFLFGDDNKLPVDIIAIEDTKLLIISKSVLMELFKKDETILRNYLDIVANRTQLLTKKN